MLTLLDCIAIWPTLPAEAMPFFERALATIAERRSMAARSASLDRSTVECLVERVGKVFDAKIAELSGAVQERLGELSPGSRPPRTVVSTVTREPSCPGDHMTTAEVAAFALRDVKTVLRARKNGRLVSCGGSGGTPGGGGKYVFDRREVERWRAGLAQPSALPGTLNQPDPRNVVDAALEHVLGAAPKQRKRVV